MPIAPPATVAPSPELRAMIERWRGAGAAERERIFADEIGPVLAPLFAGLPLHGAVEGRPRPTALVSLVGRAWQPAALLAAWVRPERLLLLRTKEPGDDGGPSALEMVSRLSGVPFDRIEHQWLTGGGELAVYEEVRDFIERNRLDPRSLAVDVTGGKRSMAVAGALAGLLVGAELLYVDGLETDPLTRQTVPGTEFPRHLESPVSILGDVELERIREAFDSGRYLDAERRAEDLSPRLYEPWPAEACRLLARGYGAWHRFDPARAREALGELRTLLDARAAHAGTPWVARVRPRLDVQLEHLDRVEAATAHPRSIDDGLPVVVNHLSAAARALDQEDLDDATLLLYATVERYVDLCLFVGFGLEDKSPDYRRLEGRLDLDLYREIGAKLFEGPPPERPHGPLLYLSAVQLLAALDPARMPDGDLGWVRGLGRMRNALVHGLRPTHPQASEVRSKLERVEGLVAGIVDGGREALVRRLRELAFPRMGDGAPIDLAR